MSLPEFIQAFEEALELAPGEVQPHTRLADIAKYDSMGRLSVMAMADTQMGVLLDADQLEKCKTIADLHGLVQKPE